MNWTVISATNDEEVLRRSLLSSPCLHSASGVLLQRGYACAADAYNSAIRQVSGNVLVFVHQDAYLPENWAEDLRRALDRLAILDPEWGVLGVWGVKSCGQAVGFLYDTGLGRTLGQRFDGVEEVRSLDEVLLVVRKDSGLVFDERLVGFHMYGSDLCLEAKRRGMRSYAISAFCIHNTNGYKQLPLQFWKLYLQMRKKWRSELPITTSCIRITRGCYPMFHWIADRSLHLILGRHKPGKRVADPACLYRQIMRASGVGESQTCRS